MTVERSPSVNHVDWTSLLPNPPIVSSFLSSWKSIQLAHFHQPSMHIPEVSSTQHIIGIPLGHQAVEVDQAVELSLVTDSRRETLSYKEIDYTKDVTSLIPADVPHSARSNSNFKSLEMILCYLEPSSVAQIAYESINPDRVELLTFTKKADSFIKHLGLALRSSLEIDKKGSRFYADSIATALSAYLLRCYSTRNHQFREYEDGLPRRKLNQAIDYIQAHLDENVSLNDIASELGMSHYYFCRLFKQSMGMSAHQYLMRQRVERAKQLLKQSDRSITSIALDCGFANQSHFAKYFRRYIGISPKQFRKLYQ